MLKVAVVVVVVVLVLVAMALRGRSLVRRQAARGETYAKLRDQIVGGSARGLGITLPEGQRVWALMMELGYPKAVATVVALRDGNASIYLSTGGGAIGGAGREPVRQAAQQAVAVAEAQAEGLRPATEFPGPAVGEVVFYVLATDGAYTARVQEAALQQRTHPLAALYMAGQGIVTQFRLAQEQEGKQPTS